MALKQTIADEVKQLREDLMWAQRTVEQWEDYTWAVSKQGTKAWLDAFYVVSNVYGKQ